MRTLYVEGNQISATLAFLELLREKWREFLTHNMGCNLGFQHYAKEWYSYPSIVDIAIIYIQTKNIEAGSLNSKDYGY